MSEDSPNWEDAPFKEFVEQLKEWEKIDTAFFGEEYLQRRAFLSALLVKADIVKHAEEVISGNFEATLTKDGDIHVRQWTDADGMGKMCHIFLLADDFSIKSKVQEKVEVPGKHTGALENPGDRAGQFFKSY